jgi:hypothetical protein
MNMLVKELRIFFSFIAFSFCLINHCIAMDRRAPKNKQPITTVSYENRLLLNQALPKYWSIIAPDIQIRGLVDPTKRNYKCHHFALEKALELPVDLRFSTREPSMPIRFMNEFLETTKTPDKKDIAQYIAEHSSQYQYVSHLAVLETKSRFLSKWGEYPQEVSHDSESVPAVYGHRIRFKTLKLEYKNDPKKLLKDIEAKKAKKFAQLECLDNVLLIYENPKNPLKVDLKTDQDYLAFVHDYHTILDSLHEYPLSNDEMLRIATF